ncbi:MAG: ABC transporter permease [Lachnospiraceae bacterium]|nr:ABC transporter permease [Lachnospiraceae bacterium]MBR4412682.1 ABC transporter permease [Lachnospiraceae bacterium]MBR5917146.1 ABC transporter permease [Lachnospiraceae bacterium]
MGKYIIKKLIRLIITLFITSFVIFLIFELVPGDPVLDKLGTRATPELVEALRIQYGLDQPFILRYLKFIGGIFTLDFGTSYSYGVPVASLLKEKIVINLFLSIIALFFVVVISFPLGIYVAKHTGGISDKIISPLNQASMSIPSFVLGLLITFFFGIVLRWFKPGGYVSFNTNFGGFLYFLIFPAFALAIPKIAMCIRLLKGNILEEAGKDYSLTAYARGNNTTGLLYRHVLKNAIMPTITFIGMIAADMICSGIVIEQVFSIPGLGQMLISSISSRDFPVVEAEVMMIALFIMLISFLTDIIHALIDPRVRI